MTNSAGEPATKPGSEPVPSPARGLALASAALAVLIYLLGFTDGVSVLVSAVPGALLLGGGLLIGVSVLPGARWLLTPAAVISAVGALQVVQNMATTSSSLGATAIIAVVLCALLLLAAVGALLVDHNLIGHGARGYGGLRIGARGGGLFQVGRPTRAQPQRDQAVGQAGVMPGGPGWVQPGAGFAGPVPGAGQAASGGSPSEASFNPGGQFAGGVYPPYPGQQAHPGGAYAAHHGQAGGPPGGQFGGGPGGGGPGGAPYGADPYGGGSYDAGQYAGGHSPPGRDASSPPWYTPSPGGYGGYPQAGSSPPEYQYLPPGPTAGTFGPPGGRGPGNQVVGERPAPFVPTQAGPREPLPPPTQAGVSSGQPLPATRRLGEPDRKEDRTSASGADIASESGPSAAAGGDRERGPDQGGGDSVNPDSASGGSGGADAGRMASSGEEPPGATSHGGRSPQAESLDNEPTSQLPSPTPRAYPRSDRGTGGGR